MDTDGKNIRIFCVVKDLKQDTKITWYHNEEPMKDDEKFQIYIDIASGYVSIYITPTKLKDLSGKFTCEFISANSTFDTKVHYEVSTNTAKDIITSWNETITNELREKIRKTEQKKAKKKIKSIQQSLKE